MKNTAFLFSINTALLFSWFYLVSFNSPNILSAKKDGISVTLKIDTPSLIHGLANDPRVDAFKTPYNISVDRWRADEGNFIDLFLSEFEKLNVNAPLAKHFYNHNIKAISRTSSNTEIKTWLNKKATDALNKTGLLMVKRALQRHLSAPIITYHYDLNQLTIALPGIVDNAFVRSTIQATGSFGFYEVYDNSKYGISGIIMKGELELGDSLNERAVNSLGIENEHPISSLLNMRFLYDETGQPSGYQVGTLIGYAKIKDTSALNALLNQDLIRDKLPLDLEFMWDYKEKEENGQRMGTVGVHAIKVPPLGPKVSDRDVQKASLDDQFEGQFGVNMVMNDLGAAKWKKMTTENLNQQIAIVVNNKVISAPVVMGVMDKSSSISGNFNKEEAKNLATQINIGSFPTPIYILSIDKL